MKYQINALVRVACMGELIATPHIDVEAARDEMEYLVGFTDFSHFIASDRSLSI